MLRRVIVLSVAVVLVGVANVASGAEYHWSNDGDGNSWCNRFNWDPNTSVPGSGDDVVIRRTYITQGDKDRGPIVDCDADAASINGPYTGQVMDVISGTVHVVGEWNWEEAGGTSTVNITGSPVVNIGGAFYSPKNDTGILNISGNPTITVTGDAKLANDSSSSCTMNMSGGSFSVGARLSWEDGGGELNMSGGATIQCAEFNFQGNSDKTWTLNLNDGTMTAIGRFRAVEKGSGNAFINLDAGTLECGSFRHDGVYAMDINEGMFIIDGNEVVAMNTDVTAGYITAFDDTVDVLVTYDEVLDKTIVKADYVEVKAWDPSPENYARDECPGVKLSWQAGAYAVDHNVYFGTSLSDVNESADPCLDHHGFTEWTPSGLELGRTYYWRVDEVDDACDGSPWVGDIWEFTTNDGNASEPYPADKETAVPRDVVLHWTPGCSADSHKVYFSSEFDEVDRRLPWAYLGEISPNTVDPCAGQLYTTTVYYWAVDEVDGNTTRSGAVWSFRSVSEIADPNLILWYKLDESEGTIASDSSGYEHHGSGFNIAGQWEPNNGRIDGCLDFDAGQHVLVPSDTLDSVSDGITVTVWVNGAPGQDEDDDMTIFDAGDLGGGDYKLTGIIPTEEPELDVFWRAGNDSNDELVWEEATPDAWKGDWHHFAFVKDESEDKMSIYFDGFLVKWKSGTISSLAGVKGKTFKLGAFNHATSDYDGKLDDFRIYNRVLSSKEIQAFIRGDLGVAWAPRPYDGQPDVTTDVNMVWNPGDYASSHNVYLGTSWDDVNDANTTTVPIYRGNQEPNEYNPGGLELDTLYYWRIDEVNDTNAAVWKGTVWRFEVANFIVIDDMETYDTTGNRIYHTYDDGYVNNSGSEVTLGQDPVDPVHGGDQSMEYAYDNADSKGWDLDYYSEISRTFTTAQDWTQADAKILTLFFYGQPENDANATEQLYAGLEDTRGAVSYAQVNYGFYGEDMNDIKEAEWHQWDTGLPDFSGVILTAVKKIYIGFGIRGNPNPGGTPGGSGTVYFDDIRLYLVKCVPWRLKPAADFTDDCIVNLADVGQMAEEWLKRDACLPMQVPAVGPVAYWDYEEGNGDTVNDSINNYDGTAEGDYEWVAGRIGSYAMEFDGGWVAVPDGGNTPQLRLEGDRMAATAWIKVTEHIDDFAELVVKGRDNYETFGLEINDGDQGLTFFVRDANVKIYDLDSERPLPEGEWLHVAGTYDGNTLTSYLNGQVEMTADIGTVELYSDPNDGFGMAGRWDDDGGRFLGSMDEVRVYSYALSAEEVAHFGTDGSGYSPLLSEVNLYDEEPSGSKSVNFRDIDVLLDSWLDEKLWPPEE